MAKKGKIKRTKKRKQREPLVTVQQQLDLDIELSKEVRRECETVRFLGHHVVDRLCDSGRHEWFSGGLGVDLAALCHGVISNYLTDLIREARTAARQSPKRDPT